MRPTGEIRRALLDAAARLAAEKGGATWREIAAAAVVVVDSQRSVAGEREQRGVAPVQARITIKHLVAAGKLESVGKTKPAGITQWCDLYAPVETPAPTDPTQRVAAQLAEMNVFG